MTYIVNAIAWIVDFLLSRKKNIVLFMPLKVFVYTLMGLFISAIVSAYGFLILFIINLLNKFFALINNINNIDTNSKLFKLLVSFLDASGLSIALNSALSLGFMLFFSYLTVKVAFMIKDFYKQVVHIISVSTTAMES